MLLAFWSAPVQAQVDFSGLNQYRGLNNQRPSDWNNRATQPARPAAQSPEQIEQAQREGLANQSNEQGLDAVRHGNYAKALAFFEDAAEKSPDNPIYKENAKLARTDIARQERVVRAKEKNTQALMAGFNGDYATAISRFEEALQIDPGNSVASKYLADARQAQFDQMNKKIWRDYEERNRPADNVRASIKNFVNAPASEIGPDLAHTQELQFGDPMIVDLRDATRTAVDPTLVKGRDMQSERKGGSAALLGEPPSPIQTVPTPVEPRYSPPATIQEGQQRLAALDKQVEETKRQLKSFGFDQRSDDFERLGELSSEQMKEINKQIKSLGEGLATDVGQEAMLTTMKKVPPKYFGELLRKLDNAGMKDTALFEALKDYAGNAKDTTPRKKLVEDAKVFVKFINDGCDLKEFANKYYDGEKQEAGLMLMSVLTGSSLGTALYDGGDAGLTYYILSHNQKQLDAITDQQLVDLKKTITRMGKIVNERNRLRKDVQAFAGK